MRVMSLNVRQGGRIALPHVLDHIADTRVDLLGLQEIREPTVASWRASLQDVGYEVVDTFALAIEHGISHPSSMRADGLMVASRWPIRALKPTRIKIAWPERLLSVVVKHPARAFEFHTTHVPNGSAAEKLYKDESRGRARDRLEKKIDTLEAAFRAVTKSKLMPRIIAGDFNEPFSESSNGAVQFWQHRCPPGLRSSLQDRWRDAAYSVFLGLAAHGMQDVFRSHHGYGKPAHSWETNPKKDDDGKQVRPPNLYRLDHLFASTDFRISSCDYDHSFRTRGLSDHAAIVADLLEPS